MDLRALFGEKYKVVLEFRGADPADLNSYIMPAAGGHYYVPGDGMMGAATDRRGPIAKRLLALPCIKGATIADDGVNAQFRVEDFPLVAKVMKPRIRRKLSPEHRAKLLAAGAKHRFSRGSKLAGASAKPHETVPVAV